MIGTARGLDILSGALKPGTGGTEAARRRLAIRDWTQPLRVANAHLLSPAVYASLLHGETLAELPAEVRRYLGYIYRENARRNAALRRQALEMLDALSKSGVEAMLLKGCSALLGKLHRGAGVRMLRDIDLMVRPRDLPNALDALHALGYRVDQRFSAGHHAHAELRRPHDPAALDLHVELVDPKHLLGAEEVWTRSEPHEHEGVAWRAPCPTDFVFHNILHAQVHFLGDFYRGVLDLHQLYDLAIAVRRFGATIDWPFIETRLEAHRLRRPLQTYLLAAGHFFDTPWPLTARPDAISRLCLLQCLAGMLAPQIPMALAPLGNLRGALAWHRMHSLYGERMPLLGMQAIHAWHFVRKSRARVIARRVFRTH